MGWEQDEILAPAPAANWPPPEIGTGKPWEADPIVATNDQLLPAGPRAAEGAIESMQAGLQASVGGLFWRGKVPDLVLDPQHAKWWERALTGISQVGADILPMALGGAFGAAAGGVAGSAVGPAGTAVGTVLGGGAGMFGIPAMMREILIQGYKSGEIKTAADFWNAIREGAGEVAKSTAKEAAVGAVTFGAGSVAARSIGTAILPAIGESMTVKTGIKVIGATDTAAQIAAMVSMPAALQGRLPDLQEFMDAAIVIGGLKLAHPIANRMATVYRKTGKTPAEQVQDAQANPKVAEELKASAEEDVANTPTFRDQLTKQEELWSIQDRLMELGKKPGGATPEDVSVALSDYADNLQLRGNAKAWAEKLPGLPRSIYEELSSLSSADRGAKEEGQLQELRRRVLEAREDPQAAMRAVWGPELADAPPELRRAIERAMVLPEAPPGHPSDLNPPPGPRFAPDQLTEAAELARTRLEALTEKATREALTDAERAERIGLTNAMGNPEALAKRFGLEPALKVPTTEERDASTQRIYDDVYRQLQEADQARTIAGTEPLGDAHAKAVAMIISREARQYGEALGRMPEDVYRERYLTIRDESAGRGAAPAEGGEPPAMPPEAARAELAPEVDLFGEPIQPEAPPQLAVADMATVEVPLANLRLSKEVPQFKKDANAAGVIVPLGGKFDRTGVGPIQVWERLDGSMEVISGRHRLDLARRSGEETIPAQIHREADGYTARQAATLDAQLNIREEQGSVADYAQYFRDSAITEPTANELGLLARAKGRAGFAIARDSSPDTMAAHRAGLLSDEAALVISQTAPGSERLQALGIAMVNDGKSAIFAANTMKAVDLMAAERQAAGAQGDIFGFDDSAMREAAAMAKKASSMQRKISEQISAVSGASRRPEIARKLGVDVQDPEGVQKKIAELKQEQYQWDNWPLYPELVAKLRAADTLKQTAPIEPESYYLVNADTGDVVAGPYKTPAEAKAAQGENTQDQITKGSAIERNPLYQDDFELKPETPAELKARDAEAVAAAKRKLAQERAGVKGPVPTVDQADLFNTQRTLFQTERNKELLDAVMEQHGEDRMGNRNARISVETANKLAKKGDPDAGPAALIAYVTDDFLRLSADTKLKEPATKALIDYVKAMPGTRTGPLYRVMGFATPEERIAFLAKVKDGETSAVQTERPVTSFTTEDPTGKGPMDHIGMDQASIWGDHKVIIQVQPRAGSTLTIGRDVSSLYGTNTVGADVLVPKDQQFRVRSIEDRNGDAWVTLEPVKGQQDRVLFQDEKQPWYYSELARSIEASPMKQGTAKAWQDYIKSRVGKGVKNEEIEATGINDWLATQEGKVTKEQVTAFMEQGGVKVTEEMKGGPEERTPKDAPIGADAKLIEDHGFMIDKSPEGDMWGVIDPEGDIYTTSGMADSARASRMTPEQKADWDGIPDHIVDAIDRVTDYLNETSTTNTKFSDYQEPGAVPGSYRELVLTLPEKRLELPPGYRVEEMPKAGETVQELTTEWNKWLADHHIQKVSADEIPRAAWDRLTEAEQRYTHEFQDRWDEATSTDQIEGVPPKYRLVFPDGSKVVMPSSQTIEQANDAAMQYLQRVDVMPKRAGFESSHFPGADYLAHTRVNDRILPDGRKVLFVEEIQSDRAQKGRTEGFTGELPKGWKMVQNGSGRWTFEDEDGVRQDRYAADTKEEAMSKLGSGKIQSAPFVTKTDSWTALVLKRLLRYAAEGNYDAISWTRGDQQVERYTSALRKAVDVIEWKKTPEGVQIVGYKGGPKGLTAERLAEINVRLDEMRNLGDNWSPTLEREETALKKERGDFGEARSKVVDTTEKESALSDAIGKSMADRIRNDPNQTGTIEGDGITVSDTGMAGYYDRIVPKVANEVLKKLGGGRVGEVNLLIGESSDKHFDSADVAHEWAAEHLGDHDYEVRAAKAHPSLYEIYDLYTHRVAQDNVNAPRTQMGFAITPAMREKIMAGQALFQKPGQERDGQHLGSYEVADRIITLFENANKSTVIHEVGHHFLENLKYFASQPNAPERIKAMWDTARREFAIGEDGNISTASHEMNARSFERYLGEGKAPSIALRAVFEQFKTWMLEIYKNLQNIGVQISPEVRDLFDRMLATDQEIADARELGVPRAYIPEARAEKVEAMIQPEPPARKIEPGFEAEKISMEPFVDELPKGPGEAPDNSHINYATINSPADVKLLMDAMARIDQANIQKQRGGTAGVKSWEQANAEQAKYVNDILGGSEDTLRLLSPRDPGAAGPDVKLGILKKLAVGAAKDSARLRDVVLEAGHDATVRQQLEYMGSIERARMIQAEFLGERAGVARALNALKDVTEGTGEIGRMLDAIGYGEAAARELFQTARTPAEEQAYMRAKLDEILQNYRGKTVLDIAKLHKEIGTLKGTFKMAKELEKATTWEMVVEGWKASLLSGPVTHTTNLFGTEGFHFLRPAVDALAATIGMARGASPGMGESDRASMSEAVARLGGMISGIKDGVKVGVATFKLDDPTGKTEAYRTAIPGRAGELIRIPLRLMGAEDAMVSTMYKRGELATLAIRQAFDENMSPSTREFAERVAYLKDHPTPEMEAAAETAGTRMTFNAPLGEKGVMLQKFVNKWDLQWMIPFIRTPINITKEVARMSPLAPMVGEWRAAIAKGGVERDRAIAEVALGTGIMALTMAMTFEGTISGAGDPDPGKNRGKVGVWQPYSRLIGDTWYEYARIQPLGTLVGMAADVATIWDHMNDEEKDKIPKLLAVAFSNAVTNQTFLQGITNVIRAMDDPTRFFSRFANQMAGSVIPNVIGQPTAMADPYVREVNGMIEAIQARIPGMRQMLLPKRDWLGEEVQSKERTGVVMPIREQKVSEDKVRLEAARLGISMAAAPKKTHIGKGTGKMGDVPLTPEERNTFAKVGGEMAHQVLTNVVNAPGYDEMSDPKKRNVFAKVLQASHQVAAVAALPPDKRVAYITSISEKMATALEPEAQ